MYIETHDAIFSISENNQTFQYIPKGKKNFFPIYNIFEIIWHVGTWSLYFKYPIV